MTKSSLLLAAAFVASPLAARPMTAVDLQSMHRMGSPDVSPDGRWAVFTVSSTDWAKNRRVNTLELLDLTRPGAQPQPIRGAEKAHDAAFGADGSLWFLMTVGDQDQLFHMTIGGAPVQASSFKGDIGGFKVAPSGDRAVVWADRDLRCPDLNCASVPDTKPIGSGRTFDQLFIRHWDTWEVPGVRSRLFGFTVAGGRLVGPGLALENLVGDVPRSRSGAAKRSASRPTAVPSFSRCARRAGPRSCRPTSTSSRFPKPGAGSRSISRRPTRRPTRFRRRPPMAGRSLMSR